MKSEASARERSPSLLAKGRLLRAIEGMKGLGEVEKLVASKLLSEAALIQEIGEYLFTLGGKRMRPVLTLLCAQALGSPEPGPALIEVAAGIELIHMATLLHDDIIDKSPMRRHKTSPYLKFGAESSLLCGDFLLTRAFSLCAHLDTFIIDATERACVDLTEGEIMETSLARAPHSVQSSLTIARKKTAALFKLGALSAAHLACSDPKVSEAFARFGETLGIAFQILDDILDVTSDEATLGKRAGIDIHERKPSIVNVLWLERRTPLALRLLQCASTEEEAFIQEAISEIRSLGVIEEARKLASSYAEEARTALARGLELCTKVDLPSAAALETIIEYTLERME